MASLANGPRGNGMKQSTWESGGQTLKSCEAVDRFGGQAGHFFSIPLCPANFLVMPRQQAMRSGGYYLFTMSDSLSRSLARCPVTSNDRGRSVALVLL